MSLGIIRYSKWSLGIIAITIISAIALSVFAYDYYNSQSAKIYSIAQNEIRSNARIASHDLSNSLSNKLSSISSNLLVLTQSPAIRAREVVRMESLLISAQTTSKDLTDFYNWADKDGKIVASSIEDNNPKGPSFVGADISFRPWYQSPKETHQAFAAPTTSSLDGLPRLFVSQPVIALDVASGTKSFDGIVYAGIGFDKIGNYLETQPSPELAGSLTLIDKSGNIVYSKDKSILGENVLGDKFQNGHLTSVILSNEKWKFGDLINRSLKGESGSTDMSIFGATNTISYDPVTVDGQIFGAIYISTPHSFASNVIALVNEQRNTSIVIIVAVGIAAVALSATVLLWNRRLDQMVRKKTQELANRSVELEVVNNELKAANDKLAALDKIRTEFINTAAHELRNPVQPIISYAKLALNGSVDKVTALNVIDEQARRLKQLASDVLSANRMESGNFTLETEVFSLADFLHKTAKTARTWIPFEKQTLLSIRAEIDENIMLTGDVNRLTLVFTNLITNALKFTDQGEVVISSCKIDARTVQIRISDTGKGIPEHMLPKLFGKFITSNSGRENPQGIGLGLYISRKIVEAHGGQIWAENNGSERSGATVIINLPLRNL